EAAGGRAARRFGYFLTIEPAGAGVHADTTPRPISTAPAHRLRASRIATIPREVNVLRFFNVRMKSPRTNRKIATTSAATIACVAPAEIRPAFAGRGPISHRKRITSPARTPARLMP